MKKKKLTTRMGALILGSIMAMSMTACGGDGGKTAADTGAAGTPETKPAESQVSPDETGSEVSSGEDTSGTVALREAKDLEGRTIKIGIWWDEYWDSTVGSLDDIPSNAYSNAETMQMKLDRIRQIEDRWNCRIEWVNLGWDGIITSINTSITAGTPDCDIYLSDAQFGIPAVLNGYAQKISTYAPADADILNDKVVLSPYSVLGSTDYLIVGSENYTIPGAVSLMAYNAGMLDSLNLEAPEKLAERGEWTWEKFAEYCQKCTRDIDGDGNTDTYGFGAVWTDVVSSICASNNAVIANSAKEGLSDAKTVEAFNFIDRLYNTDGTARFSDDWDNNWQALYQGQIAFSIQRPYHLHDNAPNVDFDVRICPLPVGPSGDGTMTPSMTVNSYFIPIGVKDPTSVYMVFEEMMNWYDGDTYYRDDPEYFEACFVDEEQLELAYKEGAKANDDLWGSIDSNGAVGDVFYGICVNKDMTVSQAIESKKQVLQDTLDAAMTLMNE